MGKAKAPGNAEAFEEEFQRMNLAAIHLRINLNAKCTVEDGTSAHKAARTSSQGH